MLKWAKNIHGICRGHRRHWPWSKYFNVEQFPHEYLYMLCGRKLLYMKKKQFCSTWIFCLSCGENWGRIVCLEIESLYYMWWSGVLVEEGERAKRRELFVARGQPSIPVQTTAHTNTITNTKKWQIKNTKYKIHQKEGCCLWLEVILPFQLASNNCTQCCNIDWHTK